MIRHAIAPAMICLTTAGPAFACKCAVTSQDAAIRSAPVVFEGRVRDIRTEGRSQLTTLAVVRPIKGVTAGETIVKVLSHTESAACGHDFRHVKKTLLVGGERAGRGVISVRRCTMYNLNP
jgi:hypothetical protein